jgi:hypothetical protein
MSDLHSHTSEQGTPDQLTTLNGDEHASQSATSEQNNLRHQSPLVPIIRFSLGRIVITPKALNQVTESAIQSGLKRHAIGDWGDIPEEDSKANEHALKNGGRLFSSYKGQDGTKFWIITEADRSVTTILLPSDY